MSELFERKQQPLFFETTSAEQAIGGMLFRHRTKQDFWR